MIQLIFGEKGTGKSKRILELANRAAAEAKGSVVFIDDDDSFMFDLNLSIRFVNASEYSLKGPKMFFGFLCGIAASDHDLEYIFIDGFTRLIGHDPDTLAGFFRSLESFLEEHKIRMVLSVDGTSSELPDYLRPFVM